MLKEWAICCCIQWETGELFNKQKPFATYYIEADTTEKAIKNLKDSFKACILTIVGTPELRLVSKAEYENG